MHAPHTPPNTHNDTHAPAQPLVVPRSRKRAKGAQKGVQGMQGMPVDLTKHDRTDTVDADADSVAPVDPANPDLPTEPRRKKKQKPTRTTPSKIVARERQARALEYRKTGMSFAKIAEKLDYSDQSAASKAVRSALDRVTQEPAETVRNLRREQLNHLLTVVWVKIEEDGDLKAVETAVKLMERMDKLDGLEQAPVTEVHTTHDVRVLSMEVNADDYLAAMKARAGLPSAPDFGAVVEGLTQPLALSGVPVHPADPVDPQTGTDDTSDGSDDVVDAVLVEETPSESTQLPRFA